MAVDKAKVAATSTAQTVTFTSSGDFLIVTNLDGAGIVYFRTDGTTAAAANENFHVAAAAGAYRVVPLPGNKSVSIYATEATTVGVEVD